VLAISELRDLSGLEKSSDFVHFVATQDYGFLTLYSCIKIYDVVEKGYRLTITNFQIFCER
jgi:hypothetical protein